MFTLTQSEPEASPLVVTSQISSAGSTYTILIDYGDTYSFVYSRVIDILCRPCDLSAIGFGTLLPNGELVVFRRWVRSLPVSGG